MENLKLKALMNSIEVYAELPVYSVSASSFYGSVTNVYTTADLERVGFIITYEHGGYAAYNLSRELLAQPVDTMLEAINLFN